MNTDRIRLFNDPRRHWFGRNDADDRVGWTRCGLPFSWGHIPPDAGRRLDCAACAAPDDAREGTPPAEVLRMAAILLADAIDPERAPMWRYGVRHALACLGLLDPEG